MKSLLSILFSLICFCTLCAQQSTSSLMFPSLNSDGSMISFAYQGDIWVVASSGGQARRITIHEGYEHSPQWSPDSKKILFSSNRYGNDDLFTISPNGKDLQRLTYHSASDMNGRWKGNGQIQFSTRRNFVQVEREAEYYMIDANGGTPYRSLDALGLEGTFSNDGNLLAFVRGTCRMSRETYVGPANRNIWTYNTVTNAYTKLTNFDGQDTAPDWGSDNRLYYLSAENGRYNIHAQAIGSDGNGVGSPTPVTNYTDEGIDHFDVSHDGTKIVYTQGAKVHVLNTAGNQGPVVVDIEVGEDYRFDPTEFENYSNAARELALSPDEKQVAFVVRGEVFVTANDEDRTLTVSPAQSPMRDESVDWLNDTTLIFLSDRDGDFDLYKVGAKNGGNILEAYEWEVSQLSNTSAEEDYFVLSPDRSQIAIVTIDGRLSIIDIDTMGMMSSPRILTEGWSAPDDLSWSPDSKWIAYVQDDLDFNEDVFIRRSDGSGTPVNVSMHPRSDDSPVWSKDGSKLGFRSIRNNGDSDIWFAWLNKEDWEQTQSDWDDLEYEDDDDKKEDAKEEKKDVVIDIEGIHERLLQVTEMPGNEGSLLISPDGEDFYFTTNGGGRTTGSGDREFKKVKWNGEDMETVLSDGNIGALSWDKKGKNIYFISRGGSLNKMGADGKKKTSIKFKAKMNIDHKAERRQIFDEGWRTIRDRFYDPNFHGQDWNALRTQYEARAIGASTNQDFMYYFNQMLGQINASHMGLRGSGDEETQRARTGRIGLEFKPHPQGVEITRIVPDSPGDKKRSKLEIGEIVTAVNGQAVANRNIHELLNETADERLQLSLTGPSGDRNVVIRPSNSTRDLLYEEWINDRKKLVEEYSGGRLGYIHIRGMNWSSFERFERELMASGYGKEGVVIDVRYNGGGWTTDMVMAVLNVRQHAYTVPRGATDDLKRDHLKYKEHYPYGERLPLSAWTKPSIALCNENSYSNAEIFSHAFKTLGHGSLVGMPTFGAVISTGGRALMDGFFIRVPFRGWYVKATEENMEWGPAVPDYIIDNEPDSRIKGEDLQLQKSVEVLLGQIDN